MGDLSIHSNIDDVIRLLTDIEKKQVPFATMKTLNGLVEEMADHEKKRLADVFALRYSGRSKSSLARSITCRKIKDKRHPMVAYVGTHAEALARLETGKKRSSEKGRGIFIPTDEARVGGSFEGVVKQGFKPKQLMKKAKGKRSGKKKKRGDGKKWAPIRPFLVREGKLKGKVFIRRYSNRRTPIVKLYDLVDQVEIPEAWGFKESIIGISDKRLRRRFVIELQHAIESSRDNIKKPRFLDHIVKEDMHKQMNLGKGYADEGDSYSSSLSKASTGLPSYSGPLG